MHNKHRILCIAIFLIIALISYRLNLCVNNLESDLLTVVSIVFGFLITGLSMMIGQDFTKKLNKKIDTDTKLIQTQLQTLSSYYKNAFTISIILIILLIIHKLINLSNVYCEKIYSALILALLAINFIIILFLLRILIKMFRESV